MRQMGLVIVVLLVGLQAARADVFPSPDAAREYTDKIMERVGS